MAVAAGLGLLFPLAVVVADLDHSVAAAKQAKHLLLRHLYHFHMHICRGGRIQTDESRVAGLLQGLASAFKFF